MSARHPSLIALPIVAAFLAVLPAFGADAGASKHAASGEAEARLLLQIVALILAGRVVGEIMQRIGQPAVMGQILAGVLLGPSLFGLVWPAGEAFVFPQTAEQRTMLKAVSETGILLLLLLAGMETDISLVRKVKRAAAAASLTGIAIPFSAGFLLGQFLPPALLPDLEQRLLASLFLGTVLAISSVKIVATVVREMGFVRRNIGQVILVSAIVDDTIAWIIIAIILGLATHHGVGTWTLAVHVLGTLLFLALSFTIGRRIVARLIRLANDRLIGEAGVVATILVIMGVLALITHLIGVHTVLGAFVAGILVGQSPILTEKIDEQLRGITSGFFMPIFFGAAGLRADLTILHDPRILMLTGVMVLIASAGKAAGAFAGGYLGGLKSREAAALAAGMNARGSTEVIVATIGLSLGVLSQDLYTMVVAMALVTTMAMPPTLRWTLRRLPLEPEEQRRVDRESYDRRGFVARIERLLLAADESASGKLAMRVSGLLAGRRGKPVTLMHLARAAEMPRAGAPGRGEMAEAARSVRSAAEQADRHTDEEERSAAEVEIKVQPLPSAQAVEEEASKGYGLLVIGIEPTVAPRGGLHPRLSELAARFQGPLAIAIARGALVADPQLIGKGILVPLTGSGVSRNGLEVALALSHAASVPVTALAIASAGAHTLSEARHARRDDAEILLEAERLGTHFGVPVKCLTGRGEALQVIRRAVAGNPRCLIVLGASLRPGASLSLGRLAAGLIEKSEHALLLVAS